MTHVCNSSLLIAFVSLTHLHFDAYSCRVAAFPTSAASICTVTPNGHFLKMTAKRSMSFTAGSRSGQGWPHSPPACLTRNSSLALPIGAIPQQGVRKEVTRTRWLDCAQLCCRRSGIRHPKLGIKIPEADNHVFRP